MQIQLLCVGKVTDPHLKAGCDEFSLRIKKYADLTLHEIKDQKISKNSNLDVVKKLETQQLKEHISSKHFNIVLWERGKLYNSLEFAELLQNIMIHQHKPACFIIGGALGFANEIVENTQMTLSLSPLTFPHQLARLLLLEQIYRAFTLWKNEPYHK